MTILDRLGRQIDDGLEAARDGMEQAFQQNLRIGVTGLARAGKTVFITSLLRNLLHRDRLSGLQAVAEGRIEAARLNPQPDLTLPRFPFEAHLAMLAGDTRRAAEAMPEQADAQDACWPPGTTNISEIRLSLRYRPGSWLARQFGETRTLHLDIVDYPGEWLLDLTLLRLDYAEWSERLLADAQSADARPAASAFLAAMAQADPEAEATDAAAEALAQPFRRYLQIRRESAGAPLAMTPGRFLLPGDLAGSPVLTFAPLPAGAGGSGRRNSLRALMARRYDGYRRQVVEPFLREQFGRLNRQIVLVDTLTALAAGGARLDQLSQALDEVLQVFRHGRPSWLSRLFAPRIDRIAFCATKADHVPDPLRPDLRRLTENLCFGSSNRIRYEGAETAVFALAAIAATGEAWREVDGERRRCVAGPAEGHRGTTLFFPGAIPIDPAAPAARAGFDGPVPRFLPPPGMVAAGRGLPHLNMDHMLQFLIGDALT